MTLSKPYKSIRNIAQLKAAGYTPKSIKKELRDNLIIKLKNKQKIFEGIWGYEDTVVPDVETAILSQHNFILLGLRGQAKTRIARLMVGLLDEYIPIVEGSELCDDPLKPISRYATDLIAKYGEDTPISWLHRDQRYTEKLATPDVSVADLIGDADPIKAASLKLPYSDERVIHYGLVPRSHRQLFVINELPDLQPRIQVALFNILQEGDIQIRGFKMRLPLDIQFIFTANPEDYTNRGSIVTPLKDRIESQILTHYPKAIEISKKITLQEAKIDSTQIQSVVIPEILKDIIEQVAFEARQSEYVDAKSGVSARLTISALENLYSYAERRLLITGDLHTTARMADLWGIIPAITGKIELVYEGEQEGSGTIAQNLLSKAIKTLFIKYFPDPEKYKKKKTKNTEQESKSVSPYDTVKEWFGKGNSLDIFMTSNNKTYETELKKVQGLYDLVNKYHSTANYADKLFMMEFLLHGIAEYSLISKNRLETGVHFKDLLSSIFNPSSLHFDDDEDLDMKS
ncbi:MAG: magnesium chelatase [Cytophagales bacterium]|nr:magnesium chelatase [Cytophagales bacterium]